MRNRNADYIRTSSYEDFLNRQHETRYEVPSIYDESEPSGKERLCWWLKCSSITLVSIIIIIFIIIFIILPLVVLWSIDVQRFLVFLNIDQPSDPQYTNYKLYGAKSTRNFYMSVTDLHNQSNVIAMGVWHLLPEPLIAESDGNDKYNYDEALKNSGYDVIIYCHGQAATRIQSLPTYEVLRKSFHVIAPDYRNFGDSSVAELNEDPVVNDMVQFYKWVLQRTNAKVYVWGHSLGTGICTHTVKRLYDEKIKPFGLMLEAPFSNLRDAMPESFIGKYFAWLPWFGAIQDSIEDNGFHFLSTQHIQSVDCPIMIMHAEDDSAIPYTLGKKLAEVAISKRKPNQGNVTYYQFPANLRYNHINIHDDPRLPDYIMVFKKVCQEYNEEIEM